ncbi:MAG: D-alanyl-D-alanine carboxypeptidase family protein [Huintestinicola sp.]
MKTNGVKIFLISTFILFAVVFALFKLSYNEDDEISKDETEDNTPAQSDTLPSDTSSETTSSVMTDSEADDLQTGSETEPTETEPEIKEPKPDPSDADNTWAVFLVNEKNPVPEEYCNGIETSKVYESWREYYMDSRMAEYLKQMIKAASEDGIELIVMSAYRSIEYQQRNFDNSVDERMNEQGMTYEEAYNATLKEVQLPGYSEHNAGVAADIMSDEYVSMDDAGFEDTKAFRWLSEHAADYGFILRYPKGKQNVTGIIYEPWHYRFVGVYYAKEITDSGLTLEEYFENMGWTDEEGKAIYHLPTLE